MNVLGLITARGGSKGIPNKNLAPCGGLPLLSWTCIAARDASCLTRVVLSTDDPAIAERGRQDGVEAPFLRPAELATDSARSIDVANHAIAWLDERESWRTDVLVLLQPTSPMRTAVHVDAAFSLLAADTDTVVSVVEVPHRFAPWSLMRLENDRLHDYQPGELPFDRFRRQGQPTLYARNGPAVLVSRSTTIREGSFYGERIVPYVMTAMDSVDIDDRDDLAYADWLLCRREATR
jgi:CMP-N,N'-diacetyllegionaminic acid synthase